MDLHGGKVPTYDTVIPATLPYGFPTIISHVWKRGKVGTTLASRSSRSSHAKFKVMVTVKAKVKVNLFCTQEGRVAQQNPDYHHRSHRSHDALFGIFSSVDSSLGPCNTDVDLTD